MNENAALPGRKNKTQVGEVKLDKKAQRALAYLSGIPSTEEEVLTERTIVTEEERAEFYRLLSVWLGLQETEVKEISRTLLEVIHRLKLSSRRVKDRIESEGYLKLVRKSFRNWSAAESEGTRVLIRNLLINATARFTSPDNVLFMFIDWLDNYSDEHFMVIKKIAQAQPEGLTRKEIWQKINSEREIPGEDSAEADMFKLLILDLTTGYVIRQPREKDYYGFFVRAKTTRTGIFPAVFSPEARTSTAFDNTKKYVLTELGKQFVLYTMEETPTEVEEDGEEAAEA